MPRVSHKKATALSCVQLDESHVIRLATQVADILERDIKSNSNSDCIITSTCTVAAAVTRLLPLVASPLQPHDLLQRCACLLPPTAPPPRAQEHATSRQDGQEQQVTCVATAAAAYTVLWSVMMSCVGDVVQRGILKIFSGSACRTAVEMAGALVLRGVSLQQGQEGEGEVADSAFAGVPASVDMLLSDDIGRKLLGAHVVHVVKLLCVLPIAQCVFVTD